MSSKGEKKKTKALNAPRSVHIHRKENTWTVKTRAGTHKASDSVSLGIALRNYIKIADNMKEAKIILRNGDVKVNGKVRKDNRLPIGVFDVITIPKQEKSYRARFDKRRRLQIDELPKESNETITKVAFKKATKKGIQLTTTDGRTFINNDAKVGDSLKIKNPEGKIESVLALKTGALAYVTKGSHCAQTGNIVEIVEGTARRKKLIRLENKDKKFETTAENIIIIGDKDAAIADLKL